MEDDPHYNRRLKGTPANRFVNRKSAVILGISLSIGIGFHFLANFVRPERTESEETIRLFKMMEIKREMVSAKLSTNAGAAKDEKDKPTDNMIRRRNKEDKVESMSFDVTSDDFEENIPVFRYPKRKFSENTSKKTSKSQGKLSRANKKLTGSSQHFQSYHLLPLQDSKSNDGSTKSKHPKISGEFADSHPSPTGKMPTIEEKSTSLSQTEGSQQKDSSQEEIYIIDDLSEMEKSVCSSSEKLCPSCKCIVPVEEFSNHFSKCLHKFRYQANQKQDRKPCPICFKLFSSETEHRAHTKSCGKSHGLSTEQLITALNLQEKQTKERLALGLPSLSVIQQCETKRKNEEAKKGGKTPKDPDMQLAFALSRSLAEEEKKQRECEEDKLVSLGLHGILQEKRRSLVLPQPPPLPPSGRGSRRGRGKQRAVFQSKLMTRSSEERERIITEKVAALLVGDVCTKVVRSARPPRIPESLTYLYHKEASLWALASSGMDTEIDSHFVSELKEFIKPQNIPVGELLKSYSQVPGRLNFTSLADAETNRSPLVSDDEEEDGEFAESSAVDKYCTQLALASLLGTQEMFELSGFEDEEERASGCEKDRDGAFRDERPKSPELEENGTNEINENKDNPDNEICINKDDEPSNEISEHKANELNEISEHKLNELNNEISVNKDNELNNEISVNKDNEPEVIVIDDTVMDMNPDEGSKVDDSNAKCLEAELGRLKDSSSEFPEEGRPETNEAVCNDSPFSCSMLIISSPTRPLPSPTTKNVSCVSESSTHIDSPAAICDSLPTKVHSVADSLLSKFIYDWSSLLASGDHSDIIMETSDGTISLHTLVLLVRCPGLMKELEPDDSPESSEGFEGKRSCSFPHSVTFKKCIRWPDVAFELAYTFMVYLYTGVCRVKSKEDAVWRSLLDLATKYKCTDLMSYLGNFSKLDSNQNTLSPVNHCKENSEILGDTSNVFSQPGEDIDNQLSPPLPSGVEETSLEIPSTPRNLNQSLSNTSDHSTEREVRRENLCSQTESPDIFGDWDANTAPSVNLIATPVVTPPGSLLEIGTKLHASLSSPLEPKCSQIQFRPVEQDSDDGYSKSLKGNCSRRNLSHEFKELISSPLENGTNNSLTLQSPPSENISRPADHDLKSLDPMESPLSEISYLCYPSMNEIVDLASSNNSDNLEDNKLSPDNSAFQLKRVDKLFVASTSTHSSTGDGDPSRTKTDSPEKLDSLFKAIDPPLSTEQSIDKDASYMSQENILPPLESPLILTNGCGTNDLDDFSVMSLTPRKASGKASNPSSEESLPKEITLSPIPKSSSSSVQQGYCLSNPSVLSDESLLKSVVEMEDKLEINPFKKSTLNNGKKKRTLFKSKSCLDYDSKSFQSPVCDSFPASISPGMKTSFTITPLPDYNSMISPQLKKELDKYGIRKLSRKKAVKLLLHIYDQTHPIVDGEGEVNRENGSFERCVPVNAQNKKNSKIKKTSPKRGGNAKVVGKKKDSESSVSDELNSSMTSTTSVDSDLECLEETALFPSLPEDDDDITPTQQASFPSVVLNFIRSDPDLHQKVLLYEPIWANELHLTLKANGIKSSMGKLLDFLDDQCITFRLPSKPRTRKRRRKFSSPGKSPKKKVCKKS